MFKTILEIKPTGEMTVLKSNLQSYNDFKKVVESTLPDSYVVIYNISEMNIEPLSNNNNNTSQIGEKTVIYVLDDQSQKIQIYHKIYTTTPGLLWGNNTKITTKLITSYTFVPQNVISNDKLDKLLEEGQKTHKEIEELKKKLNFSDEIDFNLSDLILGNIIQVISYKQPSLKLVDKLIKMNKFKHIFIYSKDNYDEYNILVQNNKDKKIYLRKQYKSNERDQFENELIILDEQWLTQKHELNLLKNMQNKLIIIMNRLGTKSTYNIPLDYAFISANNINSDILKKYHKLYCSSVTNFNLFKQLFDVFTKQNHYMVINQKSNDIPSIFKQLKY